MRPRPELERIVEEVADHFGRDPDAWGRGRRVDDASRAVAAYLARRCFGYSASRVAAVLGYRSHSAVANAVVRIESAGPAVRRTAAAEKLARNLH